MSEPFTTTDDSAFPDERLSAYLDGELSEVERAQLEASLQSDPALRADLDALSEARSFFAQHGAVAAPEGFLEDLLAAVEEEPEVVQLAWYRRPFGVPIEGLAVAAAALLVVWIALPGTRDTSEPTATGAGAAIMEQTRQTKSPSSSLASGYGTDAAADAEDEAKEAAEEVATTEGTVDPTTNAWEPPVDADQDGVAVAEIDEKARGVGVNDKLAIPGAKGFDLAEKKAEEERAAAEAAQKQAEMKAAEEAQRTTRTGTNFTQVPYSYTLYTEDAEVLYRLAAIAAKHRGEVTDSEKHELEVTELSGNDGATVLVQLPAHALQAFGKEIGALGSVYASADNTMFAGDPVEVRVRVQLAAGAPSGTGTAPNAARKARESLDQLEVGEAL
ncbi:MAG: zf-HC2 domain-containing protein [Myxococcota bacterium]